MRRVMTVVPILLLLQTACGDAFAVEVSRYKYKDGSIYAAFESTDPSGCIRTNVSVAASESAIRVSSGSSIETPLAAVTISQFNTCTGLQLIQASGETPIMVFEHPANLQLARLSCTIPVYDFETDRFYDVFVEMEWEATSPVIVDGFTQGVSPGGGIQLMTHAQAQYRLARANGTVSDGTTNLTPGGSFEAQVQKIAYGEVVITRGE